MLSCAIFFIRASLKKCRLGSVFIETQKAHGPYTALFGPDGVEFLSSLGSTRLIWPAFDKILILSSGTGLRSGLLVYPIPDEALTKGMSPSEFRQRLEAWRTDT